MALSSFQVVRRSLGVFWVDNAVIDDEHLTAHAKLVYMALCRFADGNGTSAFSHRILAARTGLSVTSVQLALTRLMADHRIAHESRRDRGLPSIYRLTGWATEEEGGSVPGTEGVGARHRGGSVPGTDNGRKKEEVVRSVEQTSRANLAIAHYHDRWKALYGKQLPWGKKDSGQVARLVREYGAPEVIRLEDLWFDGHDSFAAKTCHGVGAFVTSLPRLVAAGANGEPPELDFAEPAGGMGFFPS